MKHGCVHGSSDDKAQRPETNPVWPADFIATVYAAMGIDPSGLVEDAGGRFRSMTPDGKPVMEILA